MATRIPGEDIDKLVNYEKDKPRHVIVGRSASQVYVHNSIPLFSQNCPIIPERRPIILVFFPLKSKCMYSTFFGR